MKKTKAKSKEPAKGVSKLATGKKKCTRTKRKAAQTAKTRMKSAVTKKPEGKKIFEGATEISMTENKIAVTCAKKRNVKGSYSASTTREYHDKTAANMRAFNEVLSNREVKKVTVKLKQGSKPKSVAKKTTAKKPKKLK